MAILERGALSWTMQGKAPAKINLALEITGTTPEGYHSLRSVMITLDLADELRVTGRGQEGARPEIRLEVEGGEDDVPTDERNLVVRAVALLADETPGNWPAALDIRLVKRVPSQAGLGGGSADAAAILRLLGAKRGVHPERLCELAARLGSDVPFMMTGGAALAEGRGERLRSLRAPRSWWVVLVQPPERIATAWCYRRWDELTARARPGGAEGKVDGLAVALQQGDLAGVAGNLYNDLQRPVFDLHPHLHQIPVVLREGGCAGALMTGSGSCFFGLASTRAEARGSAAAIRRRGLGQTWITRTWREAE